MKYYLVDAINGNVVDTQYAWPINCDFCSYYNQCTALNKYPISNSKTDARIFEKCTFTLHAARKLFNIPSPYKIQILPQK